MFKKFISLSTALICVISLAACGAANEQGLIAYEEDETIVSRDDEGEAEEEGEYEAESENINVSEMAVGDSFFFGTYEQDNDESNGAEPIEWVVLDQQDGKTLLLSKYGLDGIWFDIGESTEATWAESNVRSWLNTVFYDEAFDDSEKDQIVQVTNTTPDTAAYWESIEMESFPCPECDDTQDNVFLLSIEELDKYLELSTSDNDASVCLPTEYCDSKDINSPTKGVWWWLRSNGGQPCYTAVVNDSGHILYEFKYHDYKQVPAVRPAIWIGEGLHEAVAGLEDYVDPKAPVENSSVTEGGEALPYTGWGGLYSGTVNGQYYYVWLEQGTFTSTASSVGTITLLWRGSTPFEDGNELLQESARDIYMGNVDDGYEIKPGWDGAASSILTIDEDEFGNKSGRIFCFGVWMTRDDSLIYDGTTLRYK